MYNVLNIILSFLIALLNEYTDVITRFNTYNIMTHIVRVANFIQSFNAH